MSLLVCRRCTTSYALGLPYCPNCTSTDHYRQGEEENVAKITKAGGPSYGEEGPPNGVVPAQASKPDELAHSAPAPASDLDSAGEVDQDSAPAPDSGERYEELTVVELRQLIHARNSQRDDDDQLQVSGNKRDLIDRLEDDDEAQADKEQGEEDDEA